jgi:hypothetical protein
MYLALSWSPLAGVDPQAVAESIAMEFGSIPFVNSYDPFDGHLLANIDNSRDRQDVVDFAKRLDTIAPKRFRYLLYYIPRGNYIACSSGIDGARCDTIAEY